MTTDNHTPFSLPKTEESVLAFWQQHQIFQKSLALTQEKPVYNFYDGPPFATGLPHHGHLLASTIKDIIGRYYTMNGHYVERRFGWDCHGLPVEYEIDKKLGKPTDQIVEELGVKGYNDECRAIVQRYTEQWQTTINRLGRWVDFKNDYRSTHGAGFSIAPNFSQSAWFRYHNKDKKIKNLYFSAAGSHPGAGIPGVLSSAKVVENIIRSELKNDEKHRS